MPVPLIVWGAIAAALAAASAGVLLYADAKGKSLVIIGDRRSGKTTLFTFLTEGVIPAGYTPTTEPTAIKKKISFGDYALDLKLTDMSGSKTEWSNWREQSQNVSLVCLLVSWEHLEDDDARLRAIRAAKQVGSWKLAAEVFLIITFLDSAARSADQVMQDPRVRDLRNLANASKVAAVDQTDDSSRSQLGLTMLKLLSK